MLHNPQALREALRKYSPLLGDVNIAMPAADFMVAYMLNRGDLVRPRIQTPVKSDQLVGKFGKIPKGKWAAVSKQQQKITLGSPIPHGEYDMELGDFSCDKFAWGKETPKELVTGKNNALPMRIDRADSEYVAEHLVLGQELEFADTVFAASVWAQDWAGASSENLASFQFKYWNASGATPIKDISLLISRIRTRIRRKPNTIIMGDRVFAACRQSSEIKGMFPGAGEIMITEEVLARQLGVQRVFVGLASYNDAVPGQTDNMTDVFGRSLWIGYVDPSPQLNSPSAFMCIQYTGDDQGPNVDGVRAMVDFDRRRELYITEGVTYSDVVISAADAGEFVSGLVETTF